MLYTLIKLVQFVLQLLLKNRIIPITRNQTYHTSFSHNYNFISMTSHLIINFHHSSYRDKDYFNSSKQSQHNYYKDEQPSAVTGSPVGNKQLKHQQNVSYILLSH